MGLTIPGKLSCSIKKKKKKLKRSRLNKLYLQMFKEILVLLRDEMKGEKVLHFDHQKNAFFLISTFKLEICFYL
jgi:hypothetical protein